MKKHRGNRSQQLQQVHLLDRYLDQHDQLLKTARTEYKHYTRGQIEDIDFQSGLVDQFTASKNKIWSAELATGIGKTVIAARIAGKCMADGPVIYISPSAASIGDLTTGVINLFGRTLRQFGHPSTSLGALNDLSTSHDVSFITPWTMARLLKHDGARVRRLLRKVSCLIIDEAQHFPEDHDDRLAVYGKIFRAADHVGGRVAVMTGTWSRLDHRRIMGLDQPGIRISLQAACNLGRVAELYSAQVITKVRGKVRQSGNLYDFHLSRDERRKYLRGVAACVLRTHQRYPSPFAVFARSVADATSIARLFNKASRHGHMVLLTAATSVIRRKEIIESLKAGELAGYVTCAVGEESIDIPALEVVHLVRRTKSIVRNMQAIGRAMRVHPGKSRALVIDYQTMVEGMRGRFVGVTCDDIRQAADSGDEPCRNGGAIVSRDPARKTAVLDGMTMAEERALVLASNRIRMTEIVDAVDLRAERIKIRDQVMNATKGRELPAGWVDKVVDKLMQKWAA